MFNEECREVRKSTEDGQYTLGDGTEEEEEPSGNDEEG
jgi:hypothetical protein